MIIDTTNRYKKNFKKVLMSESKNNRITLIKNLEIVLDCLQNNKIIPQKYRNHKLENSRQYLNCWECHLLSDTLLVYKIDIRLDLIILFDIGSHSNLFNYNKDIWEELNEINN